MKNNNNFGRRTFVRYYRKSTKYDLELNADLIEIIIGLMLGDLFAEKRNPNSNTRLQFKQSIKNKEYIEHLYSLFKIYCQSEPAVNASLEKRTGKRDLNVSIKFWTSSIPCFNKFRELFYDSSGKKYIPLELENLITPKSLAYWAMDDGYKTINGFYFCTESFNYEENLKLARILKNKFDLNCGVHKHSNGYRLYVTSGSRDKLIELVKPYIISHFYYKFDLK